MKEADFQGYALVSTMFVVELMTALVKRKVLPGQDIKEIIDASLLRLEEVSGDAHPNTQEALLFARRFCEQQLLRIDELLKSPPPKAP